MKGLPERTVVPKIPAGNSVDCKYKHPATVSSDQKSDNTKSSKTSLWSSIFVSTISLFETDSEASVHEKRISDTRTNGWSNALRRVVTGSSMKRLQERILGPSKTFISSSTSEIWLLGECYKASKETSSSDAGHDNGLDAFEKDFSSKIWMTYRKGFDVIGDSRFTSDVNWGCMLRSSQMLVAQALLFHCLGRSWRKPSQRPFDQEYIEILHLFGDSVASPFSIHNLLQAGKAYGLAAGSWVGPYATCRSWETLARSKIQQINIGRDDQSLSMATYVVSGDEDGERGGAPVVCIEDAARLCSEFSKGQLDWTPIILLVPLVLGLDKVNPRYIPLLWATFTFPQSLGIIGGKPGASTYIVGMQDDKAFYLDPHEVQPVVDIRENFEADTSSYHCSVIRQFPLDMIDPSLAIGFYCRDKGDFDDFCVRATKLAEESNGAPLFTVAQSIKLSKTMNPDVIVNEVGDNTGETGVDNFYDQENMNDSLTQQPPEDDWQLL